MNHYRQMYNQMLEFKYSVIMQVVLSQYKDQLDLLNQHIKELDELATEIPTTRYEQFITGNEKHLQNEV